MLSLIALAPGYALAPPASPGICPGFTFYSLCRGLLTVGGFGVNSSLWALGAGHVGGARTPLGEREGFSLNFYLEVRGGRGGRPRRAGRYGSWALPEAQVRRRPGPGPVGGRARNPRVSARLCPPQRLEAE